jgi:hypothetical protein
LAAACKYSYKYLREIKMEEELGKHERHSKFTA